MPSTRIRLSLYILFVIGYLVAAQDETSPAPSPQGVMETVAPSLSLQSPTVPPTSSPTSSDHPSQTPTSSPRPTESLAPSAVPTTSQVPSSSPTDAEIFVAQQFNFDMELEGFPLILNGTNATNNPDVRTWTTITSLHVAQYWQSQNFSGFNIYNVATLFQNQFVVATSTEIPTEDEEDGGGGRLSHGNPVMTRIIYDQEIKYTVTGIDSPVPRGNDTSDVLFFLPFTQNAQGYTTLLEEAFNLTRVYLTNFTRIPITTPTVTPTPAPDNGNNSMPTASPNSESGLTNQALAATVISVALCALVAFFVVWYITKREPIEYSEDYAESVDPSYSGMMVIEEPLVFPVQESESEANTAAEESPAPPESMLNTVAVIVPAPIETTISDANLEEAIQDISDDDQVYAREGSL